MEENWKQRTEILIGKEAIKQLEKSKVIIYGIGGVGSFAVEALARAGIGNLVLVDNDVISVTNINRQIHSNINTIGQSKVKVMKERILEINPDAKVEIYMPQKGEDEEKLINSSFSYVIDAIDTVSNKIKLIMKANEEKVPIISSMGAGNKLDPSKFEVTDIYKTSVCPLARVIRKEMRARGIKKLKVVYSKEEPKAHQKEPGSISFVPSVAGLILAGEVIKDIISKKTI